MTLKNGYIHNIKTNIMKMDEFILKKDYHYSEIESACNTDDDVSMKDYGDNMMIGENFIVLANDIGDVVSFIMTGHTGISGAVYTCIYSDFNSPQY